MVPMCERKFARPHCNSSTPCQPSPARRRRDPLPSRPRPERCGLVHSDPQPRHLRGLLCPLLFKNATKPRAYHSPSSASARSAAPFPTARLPFLGVVIPEYVGRLLFISFPPGACRVRHYLFVKLQRPEPFATQLPTENLHIKKGACPPMSKNKHKNTTVRNS